MRSSNFAWNQFDSKIQTCFKGLRQLKDVRPCTSLSTSFCGSKNSLLRGTTPVRAATETEFAKREKLVRKTERFVLHTITFFFEGGL